MSRFGLDEPVRRATDGGLHSIVARIVGANEVSVRLHPVCGFAEVGVGGRWGASGDAGWAWS